MNILLNGIKPNYDFWINFWIEFSWKKDYWIIFWIEYSWKKWYWIILWIEFYREMNEWIIFWINICHFWWKVFFFVYWTLFGQFSGTFPIRPVLMTPWLLNRIIFWIESEELFLNWIIVWIDSWVKQYWMEYLINHFLAKFKHWIESDWVSATTSLLHCVLALWNKDFIFSFIELFHCLDWRSI